MSEMQVRTARPPRAERAAERPRRPVARVIGAVALTASLVLAAVFVASAGASISRSYSGTAFGPDGTATTKFDRLGAVAVDQTSGNVYAADLAAGSVYKFGPEGEASEFSSLGSNELTGFGFHSTEAGTSEIAVSPTSGTIYVADIGANAIKAYLPSGAKADFGTTNSNELTAAEAGFGEACGVAVGPAGDIYVGGFGSVAIFDSNGEKLTEIAASGACNVAVDSQGAVYVDYYYFPEGGFSGAVEKFVPDKLPVTATTTYTSAGIVDPNPSFGVAVDPTTDELSVDESSGVAQYGPEGRRLGAFADAGPGAVTESEGVAVRGDHAYVGDNGTRRVNIFGASELARPRIGQVGVGAVTATGAKVRAEIDPQGSATGFRVEYGPADCATSSCASTASIPVGSGSGLRVALAELTGLAPATTYHFRVVATSEAGATFGADQTFRTYGANESSGFALPDGRGFELVSGDAPGGTDVGVPFSAGGLINGHVKPQRASSDGEAVSFASFTAYGEASGAPAASQYLARRTAGGWTSQNISVPDATSELTDPVRGLAPDLSFAGVVNNGQALAPGASSEFENLYLRNNADGHLTALTTTVPTRSHGRFCVNYFGASADGSKVFFGANGALTADAPEPAEEGAFDLYEWSAAGGVKLINIGNVGGAEAPVALSREGGFGLGGGNCFGILNAGITEHSISRDGSVVLWTAVGPGISPTLYARLGGNRTIQLDRSQGGPDPSGGGVVADASADGSAVFFYDANRLLPGATPGDLYRYEIGPERLTDLTSGEAEPTEVQGLLGASEDGSSAYFVAFGALAAAGTDAAGQAPKQGEPNLYLWRAGQGLRFVATLLGGNGNESDAADWTTSFSGSQTENKTSKVSGDGAVAVFVSSRQLTSYDNRILGATGCQAEPDGTVYGSPRCSEVYLYDAATNRLTCASCNPSGARPTGPPPRQTGLAPLPRLNSVPSWSTPFEQPRYLSEGGRRLFFESAESLVPRDSNGRVDIYEFERAGVGSCSASSSGFDPGSDGCVFLISGGTSESDSYFIDASANGDDAFISTRQSLVGADGDDRFDVYAAQVGGGFPEPASPAAPCGSEACRGAAGPPPAATSAATAAVSGRGNVTRRVCPKRKPLRKGARCVRRPKHRRHVRHHAKDRHHSPKVGHRQTHRSAGAERRAGR